MYIRARVEEEGELKRRSPDQDPKPKSEQRQVSSTKVVSFRVLDARTKRVPYRENPSLDQANER